METDAVDRDLERFEVSDRDASHDGLDHGSMREFDKDHGFTPDRKPEAPWLPLRADR